ncbi:hypothetical protein FRACYDRAFT_234668 [Fragilariopsis cylindrus CCMP1102]|uniref:Uncharacterized protein n=1 Tax=Fragilariopsis cylindrus CCMP1102 TaxID=635003 RepID=A0A1E7FS98_9STRA|nr:hypothetical protein FRACYDRAFT_234668 [Fragilariopsis cylindrus CCMP1102]|eukprot:OEU21040.1 hypothetical protein FRACYDRAFT_234668 [Fragilariopsis cylindrus CCMP1102]
MTNPPEAKRPHLSCTTDDLPDPVESASASSINLVFTCDTPPTSDNIEFALHTIGDTKNTNTKHDILQALQDLNRWARNNNHLFFNEFLELAGISRVLKFLMIPSNMSDMKYVFSACTIIINCTRGPNSDLDIDIAQVMGRKFIERGGIHTMLLANEEYSGGNDRNELSAVHSIWAVLNNVINYNAELDYIDKDKQHNLFDDAIATLRLVNDTDDKIRVHGMIQIPHKIKSLLLLVLMRLLVGSNSKLVADDLEGRDVFQIFINTMKDSNRQWEFEEEIWKITSYFFFSCFRRQLFPTKNNNDLKLAISFYVEYIEKAPNEAFKSKAFDFLLEVSDVIGREEITKMPGLMITLGTILDRSSSNNIEAATEDMTKTLVKYLL